jgi:hypothetical protein
MTKFIETTAGTYVNADSVGRIAPGRKGSGTCRITTKDGTDFEVWGEASDVVEKISATYVPARDGFFVLNDNVENCSLEDFKRWLTPVIAWRFTDADAYPVPVTVDGPWDGVDNPQLILQPDGSVVAVHDRSWKSLDEAYESLRGGDG